MLTIETLKQWYDNGKAMGATHMVVACDTFDWDDYPCYVMPKQTVEAVAEEHNGKNMQKVMEVYNLSKPFDKQKMIGRYAFDGWSPYK